MAGSIVTYRPSSCIRALCRVLKNSALPQPDAVAALLPVVDALVEMWYPYAWIIPEATVTSVVSPINVLLLYPSH